MSEFGYRPSSLTQDEVQPAPTPPNWRWHHLAATFLAQKVIELDDQLVIAEIQQKGSSPRLYQKNVDEPPFVRLAVQVLKSAAADFCTDKIVHLVKCETCDGRGSVNAAERVPSANFLDYRTFYNSQSLVGFRIVHKNCPACNGVGHMLEICPESSADAFNAAWRI